MGGILDRHEHAGSALGGGRAGTSDSNPYWHPSIQAIVMRVVSMFKNGT